MKRNALIAVLGLCLSITTACGSSDATTDGDIAGDLNNGSTGPPTAHLVQTQPMALADGDTTTPTVQVAFSCPSGAAAISEGMNSAWNSRGQSRDFIANFPDVDASTPVAVVFAWHGVGDTAQNFHSFARGIGNRNDADFPYIMITPQGLSCSQSVVQSLVWNGTSLMVSKATTTSMPVSSKISLDAWLKIIPSMVAAFMRWALVVARSCRTFFTLATQSTSARSSACLGHGSTTSRPLVVLQPVRFRHHSVG